MRKRLALLLILAACGGGKDSGPGKDWSGKALDVTITSKVGNVGFTIKLPKGMKLEGEDDDISKYWRADTKDHWSEPSVLVSLDSLPATDLAGFIQDSMIGDDIIAKQEATTDGFVLIHHDKNKGLVSALVAKKKGEHHLSCRASQAKDGGIPNPDKTIPWLESICASMTIE